VSLDASTLTLLVAVLVMAGVVKATIGFGLPMVAVSILTQILPKEWALALMVLPIVFSNLFLGAPRHLLLPALRRFWPVVIAVGVGILIGALALSGLPQDSFLVVVGVVVIAFVLSEQFGLALPVPPGHERGIGIASGLFGGLLGGVTTVYGPPLLLYLTALRLGKQRYIAAIVVIWTAAAIFLVVVFNRSGILVGERFWWSVAACAPVGVGMWIGVRLRGRIPEEPFCQVVRLGLLLLGANLIRRGLFS